MSAMRSAPTKQEFVTAVQDAFSFLTEYGFRQEELPASPRDVFVSFVNDRVCIKVEGTSYGLNARVAFGHANTASFENYDFGDLIEARRDKIGALPRRGTIGKGSTQLEHVRSYARILREHFPSLLQGDEELFDIAIRARRIRELTFNRD